MNIPLIHPPSTNEEGAALHLPRATCLDQISAPKYFRHQTCDFNFSFFHKTRLSHPLVKNAFFFSFFLASFYFSSSFIPFIHTTFTSFPSHPNTAYLGAMPRGATSWNRQRFRSQPYGYRSTQSAQSVQQNQQSSYPGASYDAQASIIQPEHQVAPEAPSNSTGEHADGLAHVCQPIPPTEAPIPDMEPLDLPAPAPVPAPTEPELPGEKLDAPPDGAPVDVGPIEPPRGPRYHRYDSYRPRELKMVNSMSLQTISRTNSRAPPSMSIYNNSRGGGVQDNVFTKVPSASKTISFRVDSEETLLQAYRHVKAMNPSAPVGGIMFSVPPKTEKHEFLFTEVNNIRWNALTG